MKYDLLVKGGHVLDPGQGINKKLDIGISAGMIHDIYPDISPTLAKNTIEIKGNCRYVVPGLIDIHTHVAYGANTLGVGVDCCDPDTIGVRSGVTTLVDAGSAGIANFGVFPAHIIPKSKTRIICYINIGSYAFTKQGHADINCIEDINREAINNCFINNPGLVGGLKLRLIGPSMGELGEKVVMASKEISRDHGVPLMIHIGDASATTEPNATRITELTGFLLRQLDEGDIVTHLCTPHVGGILDQARQPLPQLKEARALGVVLDSALGRNNFGYKVAGEQAQLGLFPDTISSDLTAVGQKTIHSLVECMAKFMAIGYSLSDVVKMTTANSAKAIGWQDKIGAIAAGREADISIIDVFEGDFRFTDSLGQVFPGQNGIVPVHTIRAGELFAPGWGSHPWGWLPATA